MERSDRTQPSTHELETHRSVLETIRQIKEGALDPRLLSSSDRRECVRHLHGEGFNIPETAQVLAVSDRTVKRDRKLIREENAIEHDPKLAGQFAGQLIAEAEVCISKIRRTARERNCPHAVRVEAERACFHILNELGQRLQSLGFLPTAATKIAADVVHHEGGPPEYEQLEVEIQQLLQIEPAPLASEQWQDRLGQLLDQTARARIAHLVHASKVALHEGQLQEEEEGDQ